jgi:hypothetical protein
VIPHVFSWNTAHDVVVVDYDYDDDYDDDDDDNNSDNNETPYVMRPVSFKPINIYEI